jgi:hypothetical protein
MCSALDDVLPAPPDDVAPAAVLLFRADLATAHPVRTSDARPADLDALRVPQQLTIRLRAWTRYFNDNFRPADGWINGAPEPWWLSERDALPRDIATLFGPATAVRIAGGYVHTREPALSEQAAAALARLAVEIGDTQDNTPAADGTSFAFIAGTSQSPPAD